MKNIRNRKEISNPHIKRLIKDCLDTVKGIGFTVPDNLRFLECKAERRAGLACYTDTTIVLSTFIYKEDDAIVKTTILHEIAHILAGPGTHHGPVWQSIVKTINACTGYKITRCYKDSDMPIHASEKKERTYKFFFTCRGCGCKLRYMRETEFTRTYDEIMDNGKPRWTCRHCHNTFQLDTQNN